jgi:hypothetical protein
MASFASIEPNFRPTSTIWGKSRLVDPNYKPAFTGMIGTPVAPVAAMQENYTMSPLWGQAGNLAPARVKRCRLFLISSIATEMSFLPWVTPLILPSAMTGLIMSKSHQLWLEYGIFPLHLLLLPAFILW